MHLGFDRTRVARLASVAAVITAASAGFATVQASASTSIPAATGSRTLYNSIPAPLPAGMPSLGYEATSTSEFGNEVTTSHPNAPHRLKQFVVTMVSWACQTGSATDGTCQSAVGSTFAEPITLNLYNASTSGAPGSLIATQTDTFNIPYRPSAVPKCGNGGFKSPKCFHGKTADITFNFGAPNVVLPQDFVYGIAYNTSDYGASPYGDSTACHTAGPSGGDGCPYDSLNVGLSEDPANVSVGTDTYPGTVDWNTSYAPFYCDGGTGGVGTFRQDEPSPSSCWSVNSDGNPPYYVPAVKVTET
jgi:hypothetical protein